MRWKIALLATVAMLGPVPPADAARPPGVTAEVTVTPAGLPGDGEPDGCSSTIACDASVALSKDGRYVAFATSFTDILPGDSNGQIDVFVRDLVTNETELVSVAAGGGWANGPSAHPSISADGRYVAFMSQATDLTEDAVEGTHVFVRDRLLGVTTLESIGPGGVHAGFQGVDDAVITDDGNFLVFQSGGFNDDTTNDPSLPFGGINFLNTYRRDLRTGTTEMVSLTHDGRRSLSVDITLDENAVNADGSVIAFGSQRHDLVPNDTNAQSDIFVADLNAGTLERVSVASDGTQANWISYQPSLSADGRFVSFSSAASNLVPVDTTSSRVPVFSVLGGGSTTDVFVHDRATRTTERVSLTSQGREAGAAYFNDISDDGRFVIFTSPQGAYDGDTSYEDRVWMHDRLTAQTDLVSMTTAGQPMPVAFASTVAMSGDGTRIAFAGPNANSPFSVAAYVHTRPVTAAPLGVEIADSGAYLQVSGFVRLPGVEIGSASAEVSSDGGLPSVRDLSVVFRPELHDLVLRVGMEGLLPLGIPAPLGTYVGPGRQPPAPPGFTIELSGDGDSKIVITPTIDGQGDGTFEATACTPDCGPAFPAPGSTGVAGDEIRVTLPRDAVHALGETFSIVVTPRLGGSSLTVSEVAVPDVTVRVHAGEASDAAIIFTERRGRASFAAALPAGTEGPVSVTVCVAACTTTVVGVA